MVTSFEIIPPLANIVKVLRRDDFLPLIEHVLLTRKSNKALAARFFNHFLDWYQSTNQTSLTAKSVSAYIDQLVLDQIGPTSIGLRLTLIRKLAREAYLSNSISWLEYTRIRELKAPPTRKNRFGRWLTANQAQQLLNSPNPKTLVGARDLTVLSLLLNAGLRRDELIGLTFKHIQQRDNRWLIIDLLGKHEKTRTIPISQWVKDVIDRYSTIAGISSGFLIRSIGRDKIVKDSRMAYGNVWIIVKRHATQVGIPDLSPHDLRRSYAKLSRKGGAELEQIQLTLGHDSLETTQRYLGTDLDLENPPADFVPVRV